jgi:hypothetical protein
MAFVPHCKCDVFVSFAHLDDVAIGGAPPWVSQFAGDLKKMLRMRLGVREEEGLRIYFTGHSSLEAGVNLESALMENASSSAVFVAVTSPAYVADGSWTMRELMAFEQAMANGSRIFAIEHSPLDSVDEYPPMLREQKRMAFWQKHPQREIPVTMASGSDTYMQTLIDLAEQIRKHLKKMREGAGVAGATVAPSPSVPMSRPATPPAVQAVHQAAASAPATGAEGQKVYLAQSTDDLDEEREQVRRYVEQFGIEVLPAGIHPQGGPEFMEAAAADIAKADGFVQLLGRRPTRRPPDLPQGYDRVQAELAAGRGIPMLQWLRPDVDLDSVTDPAHAELLQGAHVIRVGLEAFKADIVKRLERKPPPPPVQPSSGGAGQFVFINADGSDIQLAEELRKEFKNAGLTFRTAVPAFEGSAEDVRLDLEESIVECDALLMVYGQSPPVWVRGQLRLYSKLKHRRKEPLKALAICLAPPEPKPDIGMDMPEIRQIDYRQGIASEAVRQFVAGLTQ